MLKLLGVYALIMSCIETGRSLLERRELIKGKGKARGGERKTSLLSSLVPRGQEGREVRSAMTFYGLLTYYPLPRVPLIWAFQSVLASLHEVQVS